MRHAVGISTLLVAALMSTSSIAAGCVAALKVEKGVIDKIIQCLAEIQKENDQLRQQVIDIQTKDGSGGVPIGAVVPFFFASPSVVRECPDGWSPLADVRGRVILGAGGHTNRDESGKKLREYEHADNGGEETHALTVPEMPAHSHVISKGGTDTAILGTAGASWGVRKTNGPETSELEGGGNAHNNMPPYIALYYCKKD